MSPQAELEMHLPGRLRPQLTGAMFAPAQIHIGCRPVDGHGGIGIGSDTVMSDRSSDWS